MQLFHPSLIGFDRLSAVLNELNSRGTFTPSYPPYNVVKIDENHYIIEMAVAGFSKNQLSVEIQENTLTVTAKNEDSSTTTEYVHRGIGGRAFLRKFTLMDYLEVRNVTLKDGMLKIELERVIPEALKPRVIEIKDNRDDWDSVMDPPKKLGRSKA